MSFLKQFLFGILFLAIFGLIGFGIFRLVHPAPTCSDGIQNQGEEGVDCGPVCGNVCLSSLKPVEVTESYLFPISQTSGQFIYDALFRFLNPNAEFGSSAVSYELTIFNNQNTKVADKTGSFYLLPGQSKYLYEPALKLNAAASRAELKITDVNWQKLTGIFSEDANFLVKSKEFSLTNQPGISSKVSGTISNLSNFDFDQVDIISVLFKNGQPVGAGHTDLRTFLSKTDRAYEISWTNSLPVPDRTEVEVNTNVFNNSNFLRKYGTPEKFQQP